jgi:phage tail protein X
MSICGPHTGAEAKCRNEQSQTHTYTRTQGGIEAVVTAMGRLAENAKVQEYAREALRNLALTHPDKAKIGAQVENMHEYI